MTDTISAGGRPGPGAPDPARRGGRGPGRRVARPTPCTDWTVAQVAEHAGLDQLLYASSLTGTAKPDSDAFHPAGRLGAATPSFFVDMRSAPPGRRSPPCQATPRACPCRCRRLPSRPPLPPAPRPSTPPCRLGHRQSPLGRRRRLTPAPGSRAARRGRTHRRAAARVGRLRPGHRAARRRRRRRPPPALPGPPPRFVVTKSPHAPTHPRESQGPARADAPMDVKGC